MGAIVLLAAADDAGAAALYAALLACRPRPAVQWIDSGALSMAQWSWRLPGQGDGTVQAAVRLRDGTMLRPAAGDLVVNRCPPPDPPAFAAATPADRAYSRQEAAAVLHAWLDALPARVLNPAGATAWSLHGPLRWLALARRVGLPVRGAVAGCPGRAAGRHDGWLAHPIAPEGWASAQPAPRSPGFLPGSTPQLLFEPLQPPLHRLVVCAGAVAGGEMLPDRLSTGCLSLAERAGTPLLAVDFAAAADGTPRVAQVDPRPGFDPPAAHFVAARLAALAA